MAQFILVDHSIADLGGHHYEYARHVLRAAERAGFRPVLATNRRFIPEEEATWPIHAVYQFGFWPEAAESRVAKFLLQRTWWIHPLRFVLSLTRRLLQQMRGSEIFRHGSRALALGLRAASKRAKPVLNAVTGGSRRGVDHQSLADLQQASIVFARDTKVLFEKIKLGDGDMVFFPTASVREVLGLLDFLKTSRPQANASWHLLFRRGLTEGPTKHDQEQTRVIADIRRAFETFQRQMSEREVCFYTDSTELTRQYNRLGTVRFHTLPIPHTYSSSECALSGGPLRVSYLGDARGEKGYHLLPGFVRDLQKNHGSAGKVRFIVQSNYNVREKDLRTVIARAELESFPASLVTLYEEALSSAKYKELLLASDIVLLPYDRAQYEARSSGILVEALAAGIPVVVPAGTWLSRQFLPEVLRYHEALRRQMRLLGSSVQSAMDWAFGTNAEDGRTVDGTWKVGPERSAHCRLEVPIGATHLLLSLVLRGQAREDSLILGEFDEDKAVGLERHVFLQGDAQGRCSVVVRLSPGVRYLRVFLAGDRKDEPVRIEHLRMDLLWNLPTRSVPIGTVGLSYHEPREIPDLIREIVDQYQHYRKTATQFADRWRQFHNADRLVREVRKGKRQVTRVLTAAAGR